MYSYKMCGIHFLGEDWYVKDCSSFMINFQKNVVKVL